MKLKLEELDLKTSFYACKDQSTNDMDYLQIGDGQDTDNNELNLYCGYETFYDSYPEVFSKGRYMWVKFYSNVPDVSRTNKGFKARFEAVDLGKFNPFSGGNFFLFFSMRGKFVNLHFSIAPTANERKMCYTGNAFNNDLKLNGSYGTLQSPQEPDYYPSGASCDWLITVPDGKIVKLRFDRFELEPTFGSECTADYVEALDGRYSTSKSKGRFCGFSTPDDVRSSDRYMLVRFRADTAKSYYDGFKATYTAEDKSSKF